MSDERKPRTGTKPSAAKTEKRPIGRPPEPVPADKVEEICEWIAQGKTLRQWCRENGIHYSTVYLWMEKDEDFSQRFARARDIGTDCIADEIMDIADTQKEGVTTKITDRGVEETREDMLGHRKLQVETRLKLLAKWNPKKYGDKVGVQHEGGVSLHVTSGVPEE